MWGDHQGQKWSAPQGTDGKYLVSLSHMLPATKKTWTSKPYVFSSEKWTGSNIRGKENIWLLEQCWYFSTKGAKGSCFVLVLVTKLRKKSSSEVFRRPVIYSLYSLYPDDSILLEQVFGSHLASSPYTTTKLHLNCWHCLVVLTRASLCWAPEGHTQTSGAHIYFQQCPMRKILASIKALYEGRNRKKGRHKTKWEQ